MTGKTNLPNIIQPINEANGSLYISHDITGHLLADFEKVLVSCYVFSAHVFVCHWQDFTVARLAYVCILGICQ